MASSGAPFFGAAEVGLPTAGSVEATSDIGFAQVAFCVRGLDLAPPDGYAVPDRAWPIYDQPRTVPLVEQKARQCSGRDRAHLA